MTKENEMSKELVERLNSGCTGSKGDWDIRSADDLMMDAAVEIERLNGIIEEMGECLVYHTAGRGPSKLVRGQNDKYWEAWNRTQELISKAHKVKE